MLVTFLDNTIFQFGYSFIAPGVILPLFVSRLTDSKVLIGVVAVITTALFYFPQLFTARWVESLAVKKVLPVRVGFFTDRLPVFLLPLAPLVAVANPPLALGLFFVFLTAHNLGAGLIAVGWQDMFAKVIPQARRGLFTGLTTFSGTLAAVGGGLLAARFLDDLEFPTSYTVCFTLAAVFVFLSWLFMAWTRELPVENPNPPSSQREYWRNFLSMMRQDTNFVRYLFSQFLVYFGGMAWGFVAVYAVQKWNLPEGAAGGFIAWSMIGQSLGNILFGLLGDRKGYRLVFILSTVIGLVSLLMILLLSNPDWLGAIFLLRGLSVSGLMLMIVMVLEFGRPEIRPTYIGVNNTVAGMATLIAPLAGGFVAEAFGYPPLFWTASGITVIALLLALFWFQDPRHRDERFTPHLSVNHLEER
jgi:MFS family permease